MHLPRTFALCILVLCCLGAATAQMIITKKVGNKTVTCMHTGLSSNLNDCGAMSDSYSYAFVGSITAISPVAEDEKKLQIVPEEVFHGRPATPLTVLTSQAACLTKLRVGDRWLFFLWEEKNKPIVLDYYGNDSLPVANAREQIETLRRLEKIGNFAILRGRVMRGEPFEGKVVPDVRVTAHRESDNLQFVTTTDAAGRYEFQPLPPGTYKLTVPALGSAQPDNADVEVSRGSCWDLTLARYPHGQISGHARLSDGSPMANVDVILMHADNSSFNTTRTDARGYFTFGLLRAGEYVLGMNLPGAPAWEYEGGAGANVAPPASFYYNGTVKRSDALVIKLASDEKRDDLDFITPRQ
jgi:hypothetical protein